MATLPPTRIHGIPLIDARTSPPDPRPGPVVRTTTGDVRGFWRGGCATFTGIPYAAPPVGERAFAAPAPHERWNGVRDATHQGATPQKGDHGVTLIPEPSVPGASTLNVNVFTPDPSRDAALPVLVYIHGGAYASGSIASPWYDGRAFARDGVVTVTLSYRIAFAGFGGVRDAPHNRGVRDWLRALEWVQDNARAFGGDPDRVTLAGQSAGAGAVLTLLGMPSAQHLFRAAWAMSPTLSHITADEALRLGDDVAASANVENRTAALAGLAPGVLAEAQKPHIAGRAGLGGLRRAVQRGLHVGPVIDGDLIDRPTIASLRDGVGAGKPLVIGTTDDEFTMVLDPYARALRWLPARALMWVLGLGAGRLGAYRRANRDLRGTARVLGRFVSDMEFRRYVPAVAEAHGGSTWAYRFSWRSPVRGWALHCLDVPFFFDVLDAYGVDAIAGDGPPQALADEVHASAVRFATAHDVPWERWPAARIFDLPPTTVADGSYDEVRALL